MTFVFLQVWPLAETFVTQEKKSSIFSGESFGERWQLDVSLENLKFYLFYDFYLRIVLNIFCNIFSRANSH